MMIARRHRKLLTSLVLGTWLFAHFVAVVHACNTLAPAGVHDVAMVMDAGQGGEDDCSKNCLQFCSDDTPVAGKVQFVQDQPAGQPLLVAHPDVAWNPASLSARTVDQRAHPPPDVPLLLRTLRLAL
jgi:hypothetical protein